MDSITIKPSLRVPNLNFFIPGAKFVNSNLSLRLKFNHSKPKSSPISISCKDSNSKPTKKQCNHSFYFAPVWAFAPFFHGIKDFLVLGTQRGNGFLRNAMGRRVFGLNNRGEPEKLLDEGNFDCLQSGGIGMAILSTTSMAKVRISPVLGTLAANPTFVSGLLAWATAQSTKVFLNFFVERKWDFKLLFNSGGMPSSHSALCTALTTSVALCHGIGDSLFPVCLGFSLIVMYDAIGVRRHAGMQAEVLNLIVGDLFQGHPVSQRKLKELLGHTPSQVIAGALLGILVACICCQGCLIAV